MSQQSHDLLHIENYSKKELLDIISKTSGMNLIEPSPSQINSAIKIAKQKSRGKTDLTNFFEQAQEKLTEDADELWQTEYTRPTNPDGDNERTNRLQQVQISNDEDDNFVMFRNKLNVATVHPSSQLQGEINPNMRNTIVRTANIDSQYRHVLFDNSKNTDNDEPVYTPSTDFTLELSEPLRNVLSIKLHSIHIPVTWYTFSKHIGNTCIEFDDLDVLLGEKTDYNDNIVLENAIDNSGNDVSQYTETNSINASLTETPLPACNCIPDGNYTSDTIIDILNSTFSGISTNSGSVEGGYITFTLNTFTKKVTIINVSGKNLRIYFFKPYGVVGPTYKWNKNTKVWTKSENSEQSCIQKCLKQTFTNNNLGWNLGFRLQPDPATGVVYLDIKKDQSIEAPATINVNGSPYFTLAVDDYNQNHLNNGMINIIEKSDSIPIPNYYNPNEKDNTIVGTGVPDGSSGTVPIVVGPSTTDDVAQACAIRENPRNRKVPFVTKNIYAPRRLTNAQIYSINEIISNRDKPRIRLPPPSTPNILAHIPLKDVGTLLADGSTYIEYGSSLHVHTRTYFGPVNIRKLRVQLFDDKGILVDLNGNDWSFTLIVEQLYQY